MWSASSLSTAGRKACPWSANKQRVSLERRLAKSYLKDFGCPSEVVAVKPDLPHQLVKLLMRKVPVILR